MFKATEEQGTLSKTLVNDYLLLWLEPFLIDRKALGVSKRTIHFSTVKFKSFINFCEAEQISELQQITPSTIREYILWLETAGQVAMLITVHCGLSYTGMRMNLNLKDGKTPSKKSRLQLKQRNH